MRIYISGIVKNTDTPPLYCFKVCVEGQVAAQNLKDRVVDMIQRYFDNAELKVGHFYYDKKIQSSLQSSSLGVE